MQKAIPSDSKKFRIAQFRQVHQFFYTASDMSFQANKIKRNLNICERNQTEYITGEWGVLQFLFNGIC